METNADKRNLSPDDESVKRRTALFQKYVVPHINLVYRLCITYTYEPEDVQDNYNEVLVNFFRYIDSYDPARNLQTWLHIVTKRYIMDLNQRNSCYKTSDDIDVSRIATNFLMEDEVSGHHVSMDNYHELYNDEILDAIESLKPIYREALLLQQAGYKLHEIVEISYRNGNLKTRNIETIKSRLHLAKLQMRKLINHNGETRKD